MSNFALGKARHTPLGRLLPNLSFVLFHFHYPRLFYNLDSDTISILI